MLPKYQPGQILAINPHIPVKSGDFVIVQVQTGEHEPLEYFIKRLVKITAKNYVLEQYNPKKQISFPKQHIRAAHKITSAEEL